jgi:ParB-like chromosome segregation protein Spo0J
MSWRDLMPVHPAADIFPMLHDADLLALGEDIKKNGLREPITLYDGMILDGRNRYAACKLAGIEPGFRLGAAHQESPNLARLVISDPYAYVISANIHRRHLTTEQKRDLIAKLLKATPDKSDRQIAEQTKTSPTTVGKIRKKMEVTGDVSTVDTRTDTKGRQQPAAKAKPTGKPKAEPKLTAAEWASKTRPPLTPRFAEADPFVVSVRRLLDLHAKPIKRFAGLVSEAELRKVSDFLLAVAASKPAAPDVPPTQPEARPAQVSKAGALIWAEDFSIPGGYKHYTDNNKLYRMEAGFNGFAVSYLGAPEPEILGDKLGLNEAKSLAQAHYAKRVESNAVPETGPPTTAPTDDFPTMPEFLRRGEGATA